MNQGLAVKLLGSLRSRRDTYKTCVHAKRSFYRWVCKQGLYGQMEIFRHEVYSFSAIVTNSDGSIAFLKRDPSCPSFGGYGYKHGYPTFDWHRSIACDMWERQFDGHRKRWAAVREEHDEAYFKSFEVKYEARMIAKAVNGRVRSALQMMNAASRIASV